MGITRVPVSVVRRSTVGRDVVLKTPPAWGHVHDCQVQRVQQCVTRNAAEEPDIRVIQNNHSTEIGE